MAERKENKAKVLAINPEADGLYCTYRHTDEIDKFNLSDIPEGFIDYLACLGIKHSLGDTFDTCKVDKEPGTPTQKRERLNLKWDSFCNGMKTLKVAAKPRKTREERIAIIQKAAMDEGMAEEQALSFAIKMVEAGVE